MKIKVLLTITQLLLVGIVSANTEETGLKQSLKDAYLKGANLGKHNKKLSQFKLGENLT